MIHGIIKEISFMGMPFKVDTSVELNANRRADLRKQARSAFENCEFAQMSLSKMTFEVFDEVSDWPYIPPSKTGRAWKLRVLKKKEKKALKRIAKTLFGRPQWSGRVLKL